MVKHVLGISNLMDSGITLLEGQKIGLALNEERLVRKKNIDGIPSLSLGHVNEKPDIIALAGEGLKGNPHNFRRFLRFSRGSSLANYPRDFYEFISKRRDSRLYSKKLVDYAKRRFKGSKIFLTDHHMCHAAGAHFASGNRDSIVITSDGWGDGISSGVYHGKGKDIAMLFSSPCTASLGRFYLDITRFLGFRPHRHEGKITGLAAYGKVNESLLKKFMKMVNFDEKNVRFTSDVKRYYRFSNLLQDLRWKFIVKKDYKERYDGKKKAEFLNIGDFKPLLLRLPDEDIAATAQYWVVELMKRYVTAIEDNVGRKDMCLAGGVFANVGINKAIHEISCKKIFISPNMGDGGLSMGAAFLAAAETQENPRFKFENVYLGPEFSDNEIEDDLKRSGCEYHKNEEIEYEIAELLSKGKVVARFNGKMEFGPRALGNRSILYTPIDRSVNEWLNKRLKRTEFMPFAPTTLGRFGHKCYDNLKNAENAARFMTIALDCSEWMKDSCPAAVHVDGTARPQLLRKEDNPDYYKIISEFNKITGLPSVVNTSFNMHEEPIVCSPWDAIRAFKLGHLDYLAIGRFMVKNRIRSEGS
ncbi:carbamoyltransferase [Candidatus Woesearchaeota archaeon CG10_big_fil_rev_8_21_14_0_10_44_13]|nr:MAG: carbamoyltransferase [Candidatus Woesearchaeota archaeon CG10_big_fil_rev_8_21_14_0_10_44_13]